MIFKISILINDDLLHFYPLFYLAFAYNCLSNNPITYIPFKINKILNGIRISYVIIILLY